MNRAANDLPARIDQGGVKFECEEWAGLNVAHIRFPKGADATPLLEGMPQNLCPCPHWGFVVKGSVHVRYADGEEEVVRAGSVYYWPPGHTVWVDEDYETIELSPAKEMSEVISHVARKMGIAQPEQPAYH